jgi:hypothetical protein
LGGGDLVTRRLLRRDVVSGGVTIALLALAVAACKGGEESTFGAATPSNGGHEIGGGDGFGGAPPASGASSGAGAGGGANACASITAQARLAPVNLVVMVDRSGSMGDTTEDPSFDPAKRWLPVGDALSSFFQDPASAGLRATITYFPASANECSAATYANAVVPLTDLPSGTFKTSINATRPRGDTPTRSALTGAIAQARSIAAAHPGEKTVIVFATDGEPYGCGVTTEAQQREAVAQSSADVAAVRADIPTYVVGVGPSVDLLNDVAVAGGTAPYLAITVGDPAKTKADLLAAMSAIRGQLASCDFTIPKPADGRAIDFDKVKVDLTRPGQPREGVRYDPTCAGGVGWHYDDPLAPTRVLLCDATCGEARSLSLGAVDVSFVCEDQLQRGVPK